MNKYPSPTGELSYNLEEEIKKYIRNAYELKLAAAQNDDVKLGIESLFQSLNDTGSLLHLVDKFKK